MNMQSLTHKPAKFAWSKDLYSILNRSVHTQLLTHCKHGTCYQKGMNAATSREVCAHSLHHELQASNLCIQGLKAMNMTSSTILLPFTTSMERVH